MKRYWDNLAARIDRLSLRERAIVFLMAALVLVTLINSVLLDAQFARQKQLSQKIAQEQSRTAGVQAEIQSKLAAQTADPDAANRARLQALQQQIAQMQIGLRNMQKGLVSPDKMPELLSDILKHDGRLRLVSLRKLPAVSVMEESQSAPASTGQKPLLADSVYKHGVEIVVQGNYLDMVKYMIELEGMQWQLFWGKAKLNVDDYPQATLTLTLFTLGLDKTWLNI